MIDITAVRAERVAHEARCLRIPGIGKCLAELVGEEFGDLVLESRALVVREWQIVRIGADPEHLRIDKLDRGARVVARLSLRHAGRERCRQRQQARTARAGRPRLRGLAPSI